MEHYLAPWEAAGALEEMQTAFNIPVPPTPPDPLDVCERERQRVERLLATPEPPVSSVFDQTEAIQKAITSPGPELPPQPSNVNNPSGLVLPPIA